MKTVIEKFKSNIKEKNKQACLDILTEMETLLVEDHELVDELILPANITELYNMLVEDMGVNKRAIQLKHRVPNKGKRAAMFIRAMKNGVGKLEN